MNHIQEQQAEEKAAGAEAKIVGEETVAVGGEAKASVDGSAAPDSSGNLLQFIIAIILSL